MVMILMMSLVTNRFLFGYFSVIQLSLLLYKLVVKSEGQLKALITTD